MADGTLFEADVDTLTIKRTMDLGVSDATAFGDGELWFHSNGYLYASSGKSILAIDPLSFTSRMLVEDRTHRLELSPDGTFWTTMRPDGYSNYTELAQFTPAATPCTNPDTREFVTLFRTPTSVRNRFLVTGCTLQDLFPTGPRDHLSWAGP